MQKANPLLIGAYYRPPDGTASDLDSFEQALNQLMVKTAKNSRATLIIGGDFNVGDINWEDMTVKEQSSRKGLCERMLTLINSCHMSQIQLEPTRKGQVLDILCTTNPSLLKDIKTVPGISGYDGIAVADFYLRPHTNKRPEYTIPLWTKANWDAMKKDAQKFASDFTAMHAPDSRA